MSSAVDNLHSFSCYVDKKWFKLVLKDGMLTSTSPVKLIDSQVLTDFVLDPILGIKDLKSDNRIEFVGGIRGHGELVKRCNEDCVVAFALKACTIEQLMAVADADMIMPPKSTWFEPKPRSGFIVNVFE